MYECFLKNRSNNFSFMTYELFTHLVVSVFHSYRISETQSLSIFAIVTKFAA